MESFLRNAPLEVVLRILVSTGLSALDLASLSLTCTHFRRPAGLPPNRFLPLVEVAAYQQCQKVRAFTFLAQEGVDNLRWKFGGSWCRLLRYLVRVSYPCRWGQVSISAGTSYSLAVDSKGRLFSWGEGTSGRLGLGHTQVVSTPTQVTALSGKRVLYATAAFGHSVVVCEGDELYTFGDNSFLTGFCGFEGRNEILEPQQHTGFLGQHIVGVTIGSLMGVYQNVAITHAGDLVIAKGYAEICSDSELMDVKPTPSPSEFKESALVFLSWESLMAGNCSKQFDLNHPMYTTSRVLNGVCGDGMAYLLATTEKQTGMVFQVESLVPQPVEFDWPVMALAPGNGHCLALTEDGRVFSWTPSGEKDPMDKGRTKILLQEVRLPNGAKVAQIAGGNDTSYFVDTNGRLYSMGTCEFSSLGIDTRETCPACRHVAVDGTESPFDHQGIHTPTLVTALAHEKVIQVSSQVICHDCAHTLVLTESGRVYSFGQNEEGQLGRPISRIPEPVPKLIPGLCLRCDD